MLNANNTTNEAGLQGNTTAPKKNPKINVYVGGAPLTTEFCEKIGANGFFPDPQSLVKHISATF